MISAVQRKCKYKVISSVQMLPMQLPAKLMATINNTDEPVPTPIGTRVEQEIQTRNAEIKSSNSNNAIQMRLYQHKVEQEIQTRKKEIEMSKSNNAIQTKLEQKQSGAWHPNKDKK